MIRGGCWSGGMDSPHLLLLSTALSNEEEMATTKYRVSILVEVHRSSIFLLSTLFSETQCTKVWTIRHWD
uniref:Uncharacterized protein n=1 Tax=Setaria italica TaxID=4555 RepID=K3YXE4_SETIT